VRQRAGVQISAIAFGTRHGSVYVQGDRIPLPTEPAELRAIATSTDGEFFMARNRRELERALVEIAHRLPSKG